jgi:hypothetical protein
MKVGSRPSGSRRVGTPRTRSDDEASNGHTEKHYAPYVPEYQDMIDRATRKETERAEMLPVCASFWDRARSHVPDIKVAGTPMANRILTVRSIEWPLNIVFDIQNGPVACQGRRGSDQGN